MQRVFGSATAEQMPLFDERIAILIETSEVLFEVRMLRLIG